MDKHKLGAIIAATFLATILIGGVALDQPTPEPLPKYMPCHSEGSRSCYWGEPMPLELP